jgi:hypothetical protein
MCWAGDRGADMHLIARFRVTFCAFHTFRAF